MTPSRLTPSDFKALQQVFHLDVIRWHVGRLEATVAWLEANGYIEASKQLHEALDTYKGV